MESPCVEWRILRFPYRWLPRTILKNLGWGWYSITRGIRNVWRWTPVIWEDEDFDWTHLSRIMEFKLRHMAEAIENGWTLSGPRHAKQMRLCAALLKRLREDEYAGEPPYTRYGLKLADAKATHEQEMLGRIIGKHFRSWWD